MIDRKPKIFALKIEDFITQRPRDKRVSSITGKKSLICCLEGATIMRSPTAVTNSHCTLKAMNYVGIWWGIASTLYVTKSTPAWEYATCDLILNNQFSNHKWAHLSNVVLFFSLPLILHYRWRQKSIWTLLFESWPVCKQLLILKRGIFFIVNKKKCHSSYNWLFRKHLTFAIFTIMYLQRSPLRCQRN